MIRLLRKIRHQLLSENKYSIYILYASGEIILVVVGILFALQIDNWNDKRRLRETEENLLVELRTNLQTNIVNLESDIKVQIRGAWCIDYLIDHMENRRAMNDSIPYYLAEAAYAPDVVLTSSAFETLKSYGLEIIISDHLRIQVIHLFEVIYPTLMQETKRLEDQVWPAVVVPMYQKHIRRDGKKAVPINYKAFLNDEEFINMLSFRGHLRKQSTSRKREVANQTAEVVSLIDNELKSRR